MMSSLPSPIYPTKPKRSGGVRPQLTLAKPQERRTYPYWLDLTLVFAAYFLAGRAGLAIPFTNGNVSPVWPAAGVALAAFLLAGYRVWPAVAAAAFLVNLITPIPQVAALGLVFGNTAGPLVGAWLLRRHLGDRVWFTRLRDMLTLIMLAAPVGAAISATMGNAVLFATGVYPWRHFGSAWLVWFLGDGTGVLTITPLVVVLAGQGLARQRRHWLEWTLLLVSTVLASLVIFDRHLGSAVSRDVMVFGVIPFVLWGTIRFGVTGAAVVTFLISAIALVGTAHGVGPFVGNNSLQNATLLQSFVTVVSASSLILAAVIAERARALRPQAVREAREEGEKRFRAIAETANQGIWMLDAGLLTCFVNERMTELLGYTLEDMLGRPVTDFVFEEDVLERRASLERRRHGSAEHYQGRFRKKDGSELWVDVTTTPAFDEDGAFKGALAMIGDLSAQRAAEHERQQAQKIARLLSRAVEQTADSVVITDRQGRIQYVNPAFERTTGYSRKEAMGNTPRLLKSGQHSPEFYQHLWHLILEGEPFRGTLVNRRKTGELYWAEQTISPIKDYSGNITHFVSVLKDVTELRKKQEQDVQLQLAREVQQRLYKTAVSVPALDMAAAAYPAEETGGDYFDFIEGSNNSLYVGIGDISGHGWGSALVMALTRAYVRSFAALDLEVSEILSRVNRMLAADLDDGRFATVLLIRIDRASRRLAYASAGHVPGFLLNGWGEVGSVLHSTGLPLGLFPDSLFPCRELELKSGDTLVMLTDGAMEAINSEGIEFGNEGVLEYLRAHCKESAHDIAHGLYRAVRNFAAEGGPYDDVTTVVLKANP